MPTGGFNRIPYNAQSSSTSLHLPFESCSRPSIPTAVPVSSAALLVTQRQTLALRKAKRLQIRKKKALAKREKQQLKKIKKTRPRSSASAHTLRKSPARDSVYDTKKSPIAKAKRKPTNHSFWNDLEHRFTEPSDFVLQESKREHILRQTQSQQDFARALDSIISPSSPSPTSAKGHTRNSNNDSKQPASKPLPTGMKRNIYGQIIRMTREEQQEASRKATRRRRRRSRRTTRPASSPGGRVSPGRGMQPPIEGPGPGAYESIDTMGSQSILLRCARPVTVSFNKTNRFDLLGSGDPNAYRGIGIPGPGEYTPPVPTAITGLIKHNKFIPVLTNDRFDGTNCTLVGNGFYYCSRADMLRTKFPGPKYIVKDDYLSTNTAATGGGRFNMSAPLSFVDILTKRSAKIPGPNEYQVDVAFKYVRPSKDTVVPFGTKKSASVLARPEYQTAFGYDPLLTTPGPNAYNPKSPSMVTTGDHF